MMKLMSAFKKVCIAVSLCAMVTNAANAAPSPAVSSENNQIATGLTSTTFLESVIQNGLALKSKYSAMLGVIPTAISNVPLYSFIDEWYGVRYLWGGTTKKGIDCSALVQKIYESVFHTEIVRTSLMQFKSAKIVPQKDSLKEGDLVFFKTKGNVISHVGMYLQNHYFVHSCSSKGVSINNLEDKYWSKVYAAAGKVVL